MIRTDGIVVETTDTIIKAFGVVIEIAGDDAIAVSEHFVLDAGQENGKRDHANLEKGYTSVV